MTDALNISLIVGVAALLAAIALILLAYLLRVATAEFRGPVRWYGLSTVCLIAGVLGAWLSATDAFLASAVLVIAGAHFGIMSAYLALRPPRGRAPLWWVLLLVSGGLCLGQAVLALVLRDVGTLILSATVVNVLLCAVAVADLVQAGRARRQGVMLLAAIPFALIGSAYLARLVLMAAQGGDGGLMLGSALIAFALGISSMYWGFVLILKHEAMLRDELRTARRPTEQMALQRSRFFAQMNHEIRTPLNGILGISDLLEPHLQKGEGAELLRELQASGNLLLSIVNEVLDFSKAEAGQMQIEVLPFDLGEVLRSSTAQYRRMAHSRDVELTLDIVPPDLPPVLGDPTRIGQIMHNLLSNALKFTRAGRITVRLARQGPDRIRLQVADTGIGMTEEQLSDLFQPFRQGGADTARLFGGTGLGMSIVKMLVDAMGGAITVESQPGLGTAFTLDLPLPPASAMPLQTPAAAEGSAGDLAGLTLLCADDDPINRMVLEALLQGFGVVPVMATDGHDAVRLACLARFDAYLIDISMPGMDGVETLEVLREGDRHHGADRPLAIAVTANVMRGDVDGYLAAGFDGHMAKPLRREAIEAVLQQILRHRLQGAGS
jgi:signal transduction histidine kinase/CheY-like chemotaxis protein